MSVQCADGTLPDATFDLVLVDALQRVGRLKRLGRTMSFDVADGDEADLAAAAPRQVVHARADDAADFTRLQLSLLRDAGVGDRLPTRVSALRE